MLSTSEILETQLAIPSELSHSGLALPPGLPFQRWQEIGQTLARIDRAYRWWVGDWLNYGEQTYGEMYDEALATTGLDYSSLNQCKWVAGRVEFVRRRTNLSWAHHSEVAALAPGEQDKWLERAEANNWTRQQFREWLKGPKELPEPGSAELKEPHLLRFCQSDLPTPTIVALMLRVFFPDAETALDMTYGSGSFWDGSAHVRVTGLDSNPARALDGVADFRKLDRADDSFDVTLFDPPHIADAGAESIMGARFSTYDNADLEDVIRAGASEAIRVGRLGAIIKVTDHVHGQRFVRESGWVILELGEPYDVVHQTRSNAMIDPKWNEQLSAYNNGSTYLVFRKDTPLHVRRKDAA